VTRQNFGRWLHVLVLSRSETADDDAEADGVHTFERAPDDGEPIRISVTHPEEALSLERDPLSVGILYKPGPFWCIRRPSRDFRSVAPGHVNTSSVRAAESDQGNDLPLTYCARQLRGSNIWSNNWKPLTETENRVLSRVD
jgi:hypothetical protein